MLKILVDRALMHHITFPSVCMVFALTLDRFTRHNDLCKNSVSRFLSICNLFLNRYLGFWRKKRNRTKEKIGQPCIEPVLQQKKFDSGQFSALSTCANKAVVRDWCIIVTWSFSKAKGFFCFSFNNRCRLEIWGLFCIRYFWKTKGETAIKYRVMCFYSTGNDMQSFRHFCKKRKTLQIIT